VANASVERFKKLTVELRKEVHDAAVAELNFQAHELASLIEQVAPKHLGVLAHTVGVIPGKSDTQVRVIAGGKATVRPGVSSKPYDYARADEFGTIGMAARPFFFPS
jgi:hypothetical protein